MIDLNETRAFLIGAPEVTKALGITLRTFKEEAMRYPPALQSGPNTSFKWVNLDVIAYIKSYGQFRTDVEWKRHLVSVTGGTAAALEPAIKTPELAVTA